MSLTFSTVVKKSRWSVFLVTLLSLVASVALTLVQPLEYRSSFSLLLIEKSGSLDGYAAAKSAERLSLSLGKVIGTASFADHVYEQLKNSDLPKNNDFFSTDEAVRREAWTKQVETRIQPDVGLIKVSVYQEDRQQAQAIANTLSIVLVGLGGDYLGGGKNVEMKIVDAPLVSKTPVRPNIAANVSAGLLLGLVVSLGFQYLRFLAMNKPEESVTMPMHSIPMLNAPAPVAPHIVSPGQHDPHPFQGEHFAIPTAEIHENLNDVLRHEPLPVPDRLPWDTTPTPTSTTEPQSSTGGLPLIPMPGERRSF